MQSEDKTTAGDHSLDVGKMVQQGTPQALLALPAYEKARRFDAMVQTAPPAGDLREAARLLIADAADAAPDQAARLLRVATWLEKEASHGGQ